MSLRYRGSLISSTAPTIAPGSAQSIWALQEQYQAQASSLWPPSGVGFDEYFENVILLLPGNGTNGAQNNTFLDSSANNFTITRNGNTTQGTFSPFSKADGRWGNYFDGTGDYLTISSSTAFNFGTGNFTIQGWVYMLAYTTGPALFGTTNGATTGYYVNLGGDADTLRVTSNASGTWADNITVSAGNGMRLNEWTHIALVRNGSSLTLYKNGVSVASTSSAASWNFSSPNNAGYIGRVNNGVSTQELNGYISNLRVSNVAESISVPTSPLTAISGTVLLTCQNNRLIDNSTNAFAITRNGDVAVTTFSPFPTLTAYAAGTNGGSGYFDGSGDVLTGSSGGSLGSGDFTIEFWVYATSWSTFGGCVENTNTGRYQVGFTGTNQIIFYSGTAIATTSSGTAPLNQWLHVAICRSGSSSNNLSLWINGANRAQGTTTTNYSDDGLRVGQSFDGYGIAGYISNLRIVKGVAVYTGTTFTPPTAPLTAITNTSLLLNYTNGGIIDTSMSNNLETVNQAQISNTQSKFGGTSIYFDGTDDNIVIPYNTIYSLGAGDFTVEGWFYFSNLSTTARGIVALGDGANGGGPYNAWSLRYFGSEGSNQIAFSRYDGTSYDYITSGLTLSADTWYHIAVSRSSGTLRIFVNGTSYYSATVTLSFNAVNTNPLRIALQYYGPAGGYGGPRYWNGYIDDLRITKGVGRYTSNFTAPSVQFNGFGN